MRHLSLIDDLRAENEWQPIETAPSNEHILVHGDYLTIIAFKDAGSWFEPSGDEIPDIIPAYWKPLPKPPQTMDG